MGIFEKKVRPPPRQPGTHTNSEVKEALKARALRRTILITAVVFLLFASLAVVSSIAQEYTGEEDSTSVPKLVWVVATEMSPRMVERAMISNKAPFTRILTHIGGIYSRIYANYSDDDVTAEMNKSEQIASRLVKLLTGSSKETSTTLDGHVSVLGELKKEGIMPVVVAPGAYWSSGNNADGKCEHVGIFDTECLGTACPSTKKKDYCNTYRKYISCDDKSQLFRDEIVDGFEKVITEGADVLYFQMQSFGEQDEVNAADLSEVVRRVQLRSEMNLLDNAIGKIALALVERTKAKRENWLIIVTCEGVNKDRSAPLIMAAYSRGELVQLAPLDATQTYYTTDLRRTVLKWFGITPSDDKSNRYLGICSTGINVKNCRGGKK